MVALTQIEVWERWLVALRLVHSKDHCAQWHCFLTISTLVWTKTRHSYHHGILEDPVEYLPQPVKQYLKQLQAIGWRWHKKLPEKRPNCLVRPTRTRKRKFNLVEDCPQFGKDPSPSRIGHISVGCWSWTDQEKTPKCPQSLSPWGSEHMLQHWLITQPWMEWDWKP